MESHRIARMGGLYTIWGIKIRGMSIDKLTVAKWLLLLLLLLLQESNTTTENYRRYAGESYYCRLAAILSI